MGLIMQNGISYGGVDIVKLTQAEYDALPESKNSDGILYAFTDGESSSSGGGTSKPVELTKAQYEALGDSVNTDGILYAITDGDELSAKNLSYDGSKTRLGNNVQDAIDSCFQSVSNGKALVASAITDKGVTTASDATFATIANNINSIEIESSESISQLVPKLTANTSSVLSSGNRNATDFPPYKAFNRTNTAGSDSWIGEGASGTIGYNFESKKTVKLIYIENRNSSDTAAVKGFTLQGSDDLSSWKDIQSFTNSETNYLMNNYFFVSAKNSYKAFRIKTTSGYNSNYIAIAKLQFLGY